MFPDEGLGIFGNVNGPGNNHSPGDTLRVILSYIADILLQEEQWLTPDTGCTYPSPWKNASSIFPPEKDTLLTPNLTDYVGRYGNRVFPDVSIVKVSDSLVFDMNRIKGKLHPTHTEDLFSLELTDPWEYAIEKVLSENYTSMSQFKFTRNEENETNGFDWLLDSWITFEKGVYLLDESDDPSGDISSPAENVKNSYCLIIGVFLLMAYSS